MIYFWTVSKEENEQIVYVGIKNTKKSPLRFSKGHSVATALLHPDFDGKEKKIYFGFISNLIIGEQDEFDQESTNFIKKQVTEE